MIYRAIGVMSGSSLDGLDIAFAEFQANSEKPGKWIHQIQQTHCYPYAGEWKEKLNNATTLDALAFQLLHTEYGRYIGKRIKQFIDDNDLHYQVALVCSHGHTVFHLPSAKMTAQLGDGAAIAAETGLPVISDLRALDVAFGGQGAPIVPVGEKLLLSEYDIFLNLGGIANISFNTEPYVAFDICPANRVLNMLANEAGKDYDDKGAMAARGTANERLLVRLNDLTYYKRPHPKSLANDFGTGVIYPIIHDSGLLVEDALATYVLHVVAQIKNAIAGSFVRQPGKSSKLLVTGGGAFNEFLIQKLSSELRPLDIEVIVPEDTLVKYKEAMIMAFIGVLRWRQEYNVLASVTGASRNSIGGALWIGQEG